MRYLGIDYGTKRIGIAVSDDDGRMAFPAGIIENQGNDTAPKEVAKRMVKENIGFVVVGLPVGLDGKETEQSRITRSFIDGLKKLTTVHVETQNEMLTSRMAKAAGMQDEHIDASSAAIILQSYLDKRNSKP
ncbi:MAG: Holliday junction resolvase RuvX [bacterium]|nr:Holliday junction resolvase RuvX [bacterium]MDZ4286277.1 Holliday junction resolvase RuvX [Candidatus Sungbacteria bacterium]